MANLVAVVEEGAGRVTLLGPRRAPARCERDHLTQGCWFGPLGVVRSFDVPPGPHNAAANGSVVLVTHPSGGRVTRIDVKSGDVRSAELGTEPHDVKFAPGGERAFVADEDGRRLFVVDAQTLETISEIPMPGRAHDVIVDGDDLWVTMVGRDELARVRGGDVRLVPTGMSPHDLILDGEGRIWFSNWDSDDLGIFDIATERVEPAPTGVSEPHHFALARDGTIWVSDNGGDSVVGFRDEDVVHVSVGPAPHHLAFVDSRLVAAVSGSGEAVVIEDGAVIGRVQLEPGLHGVAATATT
jgi:DNA-binding beta-propeller fold protein YncE